jgi:RNA polymerase sigma-70 factor (ECF subfamily)
VLDVCHGVATVLLPESLLRSRPASVRINGMTTTSASLLEQLRHAGDQAAWERFVRLYTPLLHFWARRRLGLDDPGAADLVQEVFLVLVKKLPEFQYDPRKRFRAWLWTVTVNKWRERHRRPVPGEGAAAEALPDLAVPDPADDVAEREYRGHLVRRALQLMQAEFQATTWKAFWECVTTEQSAAEVAASLGLTIEAVYSAKSRVLRRLRQELQGLLD